MPIKVARVNWFSTYHVHHRVAERFEKAERSLLGDAAHIHSPIVGQGMNTGIGERSILLGNWLPLFRNGLTPRFWTAANRSALPLRDASSRRLIKLSRL